MSDLISRQTAINALDTGLWGSEWDKALATAILKDLPSANGVEVVRCRDCRYFNTTFPLLRMCDITWTKMEPDEYCSLGERKEQ